ncbi:uncharacterized protein LOC114383853 [Glycine soja]|uniref:uncharacterized protein LOC114383853 n=1 Tax=Glycine soja TaxID=3848 RepID=UPI00103F5ED7|nr:uncharacterized protein LOC114383853 [Glycine soja]
MGRKWAANRQSLWNEFNDPTKTRDEIIKNVPIGIDKDQWARFVHYRHKPSTLELCRRNKEIQSKQVIPHTGGSKANPRRRNELLLETGKLPSRGQLYIETHKRKDGSFVNEVAKTIAEQIEVVLTQSIVDESEVSPLDVVGRVVGIPIDSEPYAPIKRSFLIGVAVVASFGYSKERDGSWVKLVKEEFGYDDGFNYNKELDFDATLSK